MKSLIPSRHSKKRQSQSTEMRFAKVDHLVDMRLILCVVTCGYL